MSDQTDYSGLYHYKDGISNMKILVIKQHKIAYPEYKVHILTKVQNKDRYASELTQSNMNFMISMGYLTKIKTTSLSLNRGI